ncbi:MAG TPA: Fic family protein [Alphaproteobacteria bacterium]|nr:Fic family protein [Alphaproteobacteria bacterium]HNS44170.1 Fic family protein [Alphaproteobacteria bacterium]
MAKPSEKLAESLEELHALQMRGKVAIKSGDLGRTHRERLIKNGFLQEVMKGWYIPIRPDDKAGESTAWYASFWNFCAAYLEERFGQKWCLSPEQSLFLHIGKTTVPAQLLVRAPEAHNNTIGFPHKTSLLEVKAAIPEKSGLVTVEGLNLFSLPAALLACSPNFYTQYPTDARVALSGVRDASEVLELLLEGGKSVVAGRLAGAFRNIGRGRLADEILKGMKAADYDVRESDPFAAQSPILFSNRPESPYVNRMRLMWQEMRAPIVSRFPKAPKLPKKPEAYLKRVDEVFVSDAYNSLSIEGYRVSRELIERVRDGAWNPDLNEEDKSHRDALAAKGYWQAFQSVKQSVERVLKGENAGDVADDTHNDWYRELFSPSVTAGLLKPSDLAGYRNNPVYIRKSKHVPPNVDAVRDMMPAFFDLLREEPNPAVRAILGHFVFVYIHPYMDGNGRMGRFLMNVMLASGGYPWMVVPVERRNDYMKALEKASVGQDIESFADFLASLIEQ